MAHDGSLLPWSWIKLRQIREEKLRLHREKTIDSLSALERFQEGEEVEDPDKSEEWLGIDLCFMLYL